MEEKKETQIDFVIAWVDGGDPAWQRERDRYGKMGEKTAAEETGEREKSGVACDTRDVRYRDWDCLRFWFRSVEQNAPWVHKIYFVTWGHVPKWLNGNHPKLEIVRHEDYIPGEFLPTFNSHTIELNFHRIPGLSEQFVYFNDDMFLLRQVSPGQFFRDGKPLDMLALQPVVANREDAVMPYIYLNNAMVLARYFDKRENMKQQPGAYWHPGYPLLYFGYNLLERMFPRFTGFYTVHGPSPLLKNTYEALWQREGALLSEVCSHRFRSREDVSQYLLREWQKLEGNFYPVNACRFCRYYDLSDQNTSLLHVIEKKKSPAVCINDSQKVEAYDRVKRELNEAFLKLFRKRVPLKRAEQGKSTKTERRRHGNKEQNRIFGNEYNRGGHLQNDGDSDGICDACDFYAYAE